MRDPEMCEGCASEGVSLTEYARSPGVDLSKLEPWAHKVWLCKLCAFTRLGTEVTSRRHSDETYVLQTINFVGNEILKELRKGNT